MTTRRPLVNVNGALTEMPVGDLVPAAALGSGTANGTTVLYGDGVYRAPPSGGGGGTPLSSTTVTINGVTYTTSTFQEP